MSEKVKEIYAAKYLVNRYKVLLYNAIRQGRHLEAQSYMKQINEKKREILQKYAIILD